MSKRFLYALLMPVVFGIAVLMLITYAKYRLQPAPDFIFTLAEGCPSGAYIYDSHHQTIIWKKNKNALKFCAAPVSTPIIYRYYTGLKKYQAISFAEAKKLHLTPERTSMNGFEIETGFNIKDSHGLIDMVYNQGNYYYLSLHNMREPIELAPDRTSYSHFNFLGWILS